MSVLGSSATKREARSYLQRFTPSTDASPSPKTPPASETAAQISYGNGVNLGGFYGARAVAESPKFVQQPVKQAVAALAPQLHVALVKIRAPQTLDDDTLNGIARTLSQLSRLGLLSIVVVDCNGSMAENANWRDLSTQQADRIVHAIDSYGGEGARTVDNVVGVSERSNGAETAAYLGGETYITMRKLLMTPVRRGIIPVIPPIGYTDTSQTSVPVKADDIVLALTRELAGFQPAPIPDEDPGTVRERLQALRKEVSLDRLIILDQLGGIPGSDRPNGYHVFLNMEQEFEPVKQELIKAKPLYEDGKIFQPQVKQESISDLGSSSPFSRFVETEFGCRSPSGGTEPATSEAPNPGKQHLENLQLVRSVLSMLPPSSSALLTTPDEAANSGRQPDTPFQAGGVGTRRQRNPLIHNLLTDKPVFSSSLPMGRLGSSNSSVDRELPATPASHISPTTFAKHGMHVSIFPDPEKTPWEPPQPGKPQLSLTDSHIDLPRLVHLIEDSFNRKLDVNEYLKRVNGHIAGVIIAGEYEGGALLTWELPPGVPDDGSPGSRARMVPYLDKFAVRKRSQGGSSADLVFKAMVRDCFPKGVAWRSRKDNPVNKWYFERSRGTWRLPNTGWTMFWTTPDLSLDHQTFLDYEAVCRTIEPSWADNKSLLD
jgi:amino-acid N-acetyltransferase